MSKNKSVNIKIEQDLDESESWFALRSKTNEKVAFDEIEMFIIAKTVKRIVRTYLKLKDLFTFNFKKGINNV
jgi:hypothetical protein